MFGQTLNLNKVRLAAPFYFGPKAKLQLIDATIRFRIHIFQSCLVFPHYQIRCPEADVAGLPRSEKQNTAHDRAGTTTMESMFNALIEKLGFQKLCH